MLPEFASNGEAADLELGVWEAIVGLGNDTYLLIPGPFTGWGNIQDKFQF